MTAALQELLTINPQPRVVRTRKKKRRPRDVQQGKVYKAEQRAWGLDPLDREDAWVGWSTLPHYTREETLAWFDNIRAQRWFRSRFGALRVDITFKRGGGGHTNHWGDEIAIGDSGRVELLFIHELAHAIVGQRIQTGTRPCLGHGVEYAAVLLTLVDNHLGKEMGRKYRDAFAEFGVKYRAGMPFVPRPGTHRVATKAQKRAILNREKNKPVTAHDRAVAADIIRRAAKQGVFGDCNRKPRVHALATARALEG